MKKIIIHILDRKFLYLCDNKLTINSTDLQNGRINQEESFIKAVQNCNKENKVNHKILGDEAVIIINDFYTIQDIKYLKQLFIELQFYKTTFIKESELLKDEINPHVIIDENSTRIFISKEKTLLISSITPTNEMLKTIVNNYQVINNIKIINYKKIEISQDSLIYVYTNPYNYLIDKAVH